MSLRVLQIVPGTSVDGPGLRTSVYLAGCCHRCQGCHNPSSWDFASGREMKAEEVAEIVISHGFNMTLTGGDPLMHPDLDELEKLVRLVRASGLKTWVYTGFTYEQLTAHAELRSLLPLFDAIVDGPFIESRRSPSLPFRGSDNQRIIRPDGLVITEFDNPL
ncbi:MAG: anaerobic ribonucleoside-triphosphate reductase activating protein [Muribaculaceae bacterium]|nr:anaerobic ribonucleoside-triphosphate reductase activating protein [Muribaculaceae bacterium]